jgi:hypothetical protein
LKSISLACRDAFALFQYLLYLLVAVLLEVILKSFSLQFLPQYEWPRIRRNGRCWGRRWDQSRSGHNNIV